MERSGRNILRLKRRKSRLHWWHIPIAFLVLIVIGMLSFYVYANSNINHSLKFVNNWNELNKKVNASMPADTSAFDAGEYASSQESDSSSSDSSDQTGLDVLAAEDFAKTQYKDYPIIKVKQKDKNIENILILGVDGGAPGGVGVNRSDSMIIASINIKNNTLKLSSLMRDTKTYFPNTAS